MKIEKMTLVELGKIYDSMQLQYGDKSLKSILFGGCIDSPDICFVFMNPTGKNVASYPEGQVCGHPGLGQKIFGSF